MATSPVRRILVPIDFSEASGDALRFARSLAEALGASIEALHVIDTSTRVLGGATETPTDPDDAQALLHQFIATAGASGQVEQAIAMDAAASAHRNSGPVPTAERVERGDPQERIVSIADADGFDLIVMGTRGRTGRAQVLVGSVAETVVRTSIRPVLTVRESGR